MTNALLRIHVVLISQNTFIDNNFMCSFFFFEKYNKKLEFLRPKCSDYNMRGKFLYGARVLPVEKKIS